jgi:CheY-like chemotaxis protein
MNAPTLRILIVEDNGDAAEILAMLLRMHGHEVEIAQDGSTALRIAASKPPDVALLDIGLPGGMSGYEVARRLQEQKTEKPPLLIAITGFGQEEDRRRSGEAGIHFHLLKPADGEELNDLLQRFKTIIEK